MQKKKIGSSSEEVIFKTWMRIVKLTAKWPRSIFRWPMELLLDFENYFEEMKMMEKAIICRVIICRKNLTMSVGPNDPEEYRFALEPFLQILAKMPDCEIVWDGLRELAEYTGDECLFDICPDRNALPQEGTSLNIRRLAALLKSIDIASKYYPDGFTELLQFITFQLVKRSGLNGLTFMLDGRKIAIALRNKKIGEYFGNCFLRTDNKKVDSDFVSVLLDYKFAGEKNQAFLDKFLALLKYARFIGIGDTGRVNVKIAETERAILAITDGKKYVDLAAKRIMSNLVGAGYDNLPRVEVKRKYSAPVG